MEFLIESESCISTSVAVVMLLIQLALEERAILAVPFSVDVLRDFLDLCEYVRVWLSDQPW